MYFIEIIKPWNGISMGIANNDYPSSQKFIQIEKLALEI